MNGNMMLKPALMGGLVMGVLSALPGVSLGNCCCCAWLVTGGLVAAYVLQSGTSQPISMGDGALVGLLAGLFGAVVNLVVSVPMNILTGPFQQQLIQRITESQPDLPENVRQMVDSVGVGAVSVVGTIMAFFMMLILGAIFSSLGGLLGAFFFKKNAAPGLPPPPPFTTGPSGPYIDVQ
ncbi:MAG: DUF5518 domain-containing protein [Vicinamibacterales bacterium]